MVERGGGGNLRGKGSKNPTQSSEDHLLSLIERRGHVSRRITLLGKVCLDNGLICVNTDKFVFEVVMPHVLKLGDPFLHIKMNMGPS